MEPGLVQRRGSTYKAFVSHRNGAKRRGIDFNFDFETWAAIWSASGKFSRRGVKRGGYVMARHGDKGGYEIGNVTIKTQRENIIEAHAIMADQERAQFKEENGLSVLDWLKQSIDWHFKVSWSLPIDTGRWPPGSGAIVWPTHPMPIAAKRKPKGAQ